jgi:hypothetical protein
VVHTPFHLFTCSPLQKEEAMSKKAVWICIAVFSMAPDSPPPSGDHNLCRAGHSDQIAWYAVPGLSPKETGGWIGGGRLCKGVTNGPIDGTWGWDYVGKGWYVGRVFLKWSPNCARQPKPGPYKTDGPNVPDVFSLKPIKRAAESRHGREEPEK